MIARKQLKRQDGFTLIELMTGLTIMGLALAIGMPSYSSWMVNQQTRGAAEAMKDGLQLARSEAVQRNANVEFVLTNPAGSGAEWRVQTAAPVATIQDRSKSGVSAKVTLARLPAAADRVTFNGFGRLVATNANGVAAPLTQVDLQVSGGTRPLRVTINSGGEVRMCDPDAGLPSSDPRKC